MDCTLVDGVPTIRIFVPEIYRSMTVRFGTCDNIAFQVKTTKRRFAVLLLSVGVHWSVCWSSCNWRANEWSNNETPEKILNVTHTTGFYTLCSVVAVHWYIGLSVGPSGTEKKNKWSNDETPEKISYATLIPWKSKLLRSYLYNPKSAYTL